MALHVNNPPCHPANKRVKHFGERIRPLLTFQRFGLGKLIFKWPIIQRHRHLYKKHATLQLLERSRIPARDVQDGRLDSCSA